MKKSKNYFGIKVKSKKVSKVKLPLDPNPGNMPNRIVGVLRPQKDDTTGTKWKILESTGKVTTFVLANYEHKVIRRLRQSHSRCREVRVSIKNGRLMGLTFNEYGDGRIS